MKSTTMKRAISATLFGLGIFVGIAGCAIYPMAVFTVGANDSSQEVWGISLVFLSLFPTSILALRFRLIAGCIMLFVPGFFAGLGIPVFKFISALSYPLSLAGPIIIAWYAIGIVLVIYFSIRHPERIRDTAKVFLNTDHDAELATGAPTA